MQERHDELEVQAVRRLGMFSALSWVFGSALLAHYFFPTAVSRFFSRLATAESVLLAVGAVLLISGMLWLCWASAPYALQVAKRRKTKSGVVTSASEEN